jgi:23S rRNA (cytosine1962-C5)-methyltransferase
MTATRAEQRRTRLGLGARAVISADRAKPFERRHPWVFAGSIEEVQGAPDNGDIIDLVTTEGAFLARGYINENSQIRVHVLTWNVAEAIDTAWWRDRITRAVVARAPIFERGTNVYRLINTENDGLPGLVVDRYGNYLVLQALTLGIDRRKAEIAQILNDLLHPIGIYERSDIDVRSKEGIPEAVGLLLGEEPPPLIEVIENGARFLVDVRGGHKTGFYIDQRSSRTALEQWVRLEAARGPQHILNCFSYTGGFAVYGLRGGAARVVNVDSSENMLALARQNLALNGFSADEGDFIHGNVFQVLRDFRSAGRQLDGIILDPPKFVHHQRQIEAAAQGYKDINLLAFQLIKPGGFLMTFSCSGLVDPDLFQKIVFGALMDSGREGQIVMRLGQTEDHPVSLTFPEGLYLKGLLCRVW